jgi:ATP-dependent helicase/nuclease subunit A
MSLDPIADANSIQQRAANPEACVWVAASAGTGKTKALTDRVLSLLLAGVEPSKILCLTFTRAAAANMANRVNQRLAHWAHANDKDLTEELNALTGRTPTKAEMRQARRLFAAVLDAPGGLRIATIHAFCESVLKRFPVEAGLAPHFEVIDERTSGELLQRARDQISSAVADGALTRIAERINEEQFANLMAALAREHGRFAALFARFGGLDGLLAALARALNIKPGEDERAILSGACADHAFNHGDLRHVCAALANGSAADQKRGVDIALFLEAKIEQRIELLEDYRLIYLTEKNTIRKSLATKAVMTALGSKAESLAKEAERLMALDDRLKAARLFAATGDLLTVGSALLDAYGRLKAARAALDYDDLILKTRELLSTRDGTQWVLYKLDRGIDHILVDEAQDTNPDQWDVIRSLAEEFFAGEGARERLGTVFAVGDAKQSIYSFQRADPDAFAAMRAHFRDKAKAVATKWEDLGLNVSFRSVVPVLAAVDQVFADATAADGVAEGVEKIVHRTARLKEAGVVEVWPAIDATDAAAIVAWQPPLETARIGSPSAQLAMQVADTVAGWLNNKTLLESQGRPIRPGDVMILVRQRTGFMNQLVRALKERNVPVAGVDRMVLTDQLVVQDMLALARFVLLPEDDLNLAALLKSPLVGLTEDQLFAVANGRSASLWLSLKARAEAEPKSAFASADKRLSTWLGRADFARPFELFAHVLYAEGGRKQLLARLGVDADDPLSEFLAMALAYEQEETPSLQGFIAWIEAGEAEVKRDLDSPVRDEVRVMTAHGAKGLQAPIVFMPDTMQVASKDPPINWIAATPTDSGNDPFVKLPLWLPRAAEADPVARAERAARALRDSREYHRLLYVAMTRAEDRLYVGGFRNKRTSANNWYELIERGLAGSAEKKDEKLVLSAAQEKPPKVQKAAEEETAIPDISEIPWIAEPAVRETSATRPLTPSRFIVEEEIPEREPAIVSPLADGGERFKRGIAAHRLLQVLPVVAPDKRRAKAESLAAEFGFAKKAAADLAEEMLSVLAHPDLAALFAPGSLPEVPFAGRLGEDGAEIVGRIDRMAVTETEVIVADYKTNRPVPRDAASVPPIYLRQMALYRAALLRAFPGKRVRAILVYTDGPKVIELPTATLDDIISRISAPR